VTSKLKRFKVKIEKAAHSKKRIILFSKKTNKRFVIPDAPDGSQKVNRFEHLSDTI